MIGDPAPWSAATGIAPKSLDEVLASSPASLQDRWFARLYFIKPVAIGALALFWIATGVIALGPGRAPSMAHLGEAGVRGALADVISDRRRAVRHRARAVAAVCAAPRGRCSSPCWRSPRSTSWSAPLLAPQLWADPLGPLTKIVPMLVATLFTLAILEER